MGQNLINMLFLIRFSCCGDGCFVDVVQTKRAINGLMLMKFTAYKSQICRRCDFEIFCAKKLSEMTLLIILGLLVHPKKTEENIRGTMEAIDSV